MPQGQAVQRLVGQMTAFGFAIRQIDVGALFRLPKRSPAKDLP